MPWLWLAIAVGSGCSPFDGVSSDNPALDGQRQGEGAVDSGPDTEPPTQAPVAVAPDALDRIGECEAKHPPYPPRADQVPRTDTSLPDLYLAGHQIESGDLEVDGEPRWRTLGYDLDGVCSDRPRTHACTPAEWAPAAAEGTIDGVNGIDNAMGHAFHIVRDMYNGGSPTELGNRIADDGYRTFIIRIGDYNGEPYDAQVTVALFSATQATPGSKPLWMGKDEWNGFDTFFELEDGELPEPGAPLPDARFVAHDAYVTGHRLVARFPEAGSVHGLFRRFVVTGTLREDEGFGWVLDDALMAGRISIDNLLATAGVMFVPGEMVFTCTDHPMYEERKATLCSLADVSFAGEDSRTSPCDGASWAWKFDAVPAKLVGIVKEVISMPCSEGKRPGIDDHCDPSLGAGTEHAP